MDLLEADLRKSDIALNLQGVDSVQWLQSMAKLQQMLIVYSNLSIEKKTIKYKYNIRLLCILEKKHLFLYTIYRKNVIHVYTKNGRLVKVRPLDTRSIRWGDTLIQTIIRKEET